MPLTFKVAKALKLNKVNNSKICKNNFPYAITLKLPYFFEIDLEITIF